MSRDSTTAKKHARDTLSLLPPFADFRYPFSTPPLRRLSHLHCVPYARHDRSSRCHAGTSAQSRASLRRIHSGRCATTQVRQNTRTPHGQEAANTTHSILFRRPLELCTTLTAASFLVRCLLLACGPRIRAAAATPPAHTRLRGDLEGIQTVHVIPAGVAPPRRVQFNSLFTHGAARGAVTCRASQSGPGC